MPTAHHRWAAIAKGLRRISASGDDASALVPAIATRVSSLVLSTTISIMYTEMAAAQTSDEVLVTNSQTARLEQIVVIGDKQIQDSQKAPIAIQSATEQALLELNVKDFTNLNKVFPHVQQFQGAGSTVVSIRGVRSTSFDPFDESPNPVYVDGNYISRANYLNGFFYDVARVEVLAGPQGTMFGRNAASGLINVITNRPSFEYSAQGSIEAGDYGLRRLEAAANLPLSHNVALRIAGLDYRHNGYAQSGLDNARQQGARLQLQWNPGEGSSLLIGLDSERSNPKGPAFNILAVNSSLSPSGRTFVNPSSPRDDAQTDGTNNQSALDNRTSAISAEYEYDFGLATLTVQGTHRKYDQTYNQISIAGANVTPESGHMSSVEARLASSVGEWKYIVGFFYFSENSIGYTESFTTPTLSQRQLLIDWGALETKSYAPFGQVTWTPKAWPTLHATIGGRYTVDDKSRTSPGMEQILVPGPGGVYFPLVNFVSPAQSETFKRTTYKATLGYEATETNLLYATVSTGFKSGSFVYGAMPVTPPQTNTAYEAGSKNRFLGDRLQLNVDGFYYDYKNFEQTYLNTSTFPPVLNVATAGTATIYGGEVTLDWLFTQNDRVTATLAYNHARYGSLNLAAITGVSTLPNLTGMPFVGNPTWSSTGSYTHTFPLPVGSLEATAHYQYVGSRLATQPATAQSPLLGASAYTVVDVLLRYKKDRWSLVAYVNNMTNALPINGVTVNTSGPSSGLTTGQLGPPRTYGLILSMKF